MTVYLYLNIFSNVYVELDLFIRIYVIQQNNSVILIIINKINLEKI